MERIKPLLARPGIRYLLVGASVYLFELMVIFVAQQFGASAVWAVAISFAFGTVVSFFLQKLVAFEDKRMQRRVVGVQFAAVCLLVVWNFTFTVLLAKAFENLLPVMVTRTLALAMTVTWNFYLYKTRIFKNTDAPLVG